MKFFVVLLALAAFAAPAFGRTMNRCSLAREMANLGVPRDQLARWTCIAEHESSYRTGVVHSLLKDTRLHFYFFLIYELTIKASNMGRIWVS